MNSEELFRKLLGLEEPWIIKEIKLDHQEKRVDIFIDFLRGSRFPCPVCGTPFGVHETEERIWRHLNIFQYPTYVHAREPRIKCNEPGRKTVDLPWARKGSGFPLHFEAMIVEMGREMTVSAIARMVGINENSVWRILKHYVDEARKDVDLSDLKVLGIDEFSVEKDHVYVTLFYDIKNNRVIHIEEGKESDVFGKFIMKHPFLDPSGIEHITMDMYPSYISEAKEYFPYSSIVFDHFHAIKMMNDVLDKIRRKEARENETSKHTRYDWLKNYSDLREGKGTPDACEIFGSTDITCLSFQDCTPEVTESKCFHCRIISDEMDIIGIQVKDAQYNQDWKDYKEASQWHS